MNQLRVPTIFSENRRLARIMRASRRQLVGEDSARFIAQDIEEDVIERLQFVRHMPERSLIIGNASAALTSHLEQAGKSVATSETIDPAAPFGRGDDGGDYDFIAVFGQLDAVNDLPGALIHIRGALRPGGLAIASFVGGGSLPRLRAAMLAADGDRPAPRIHPMVDPRAAPQLLQRAGWKDPVVDTHGLTVRYPSFDRLVSDLRDQGLTSALADHSPPPGKAALARARAAFMAQADADGKVAESFEIVTLTGRRSLSGT